MAYTSKLTLDGIAYDVLAGDIAFSRSVDVKGRPSSFVQGGQMHFTSESTPLSKLLENMVNLQNIPYKVGKMEFIDAGDDSMVMRTIDLTNAFIVSYSEQFSAGSEAYLCQFTLSCEKITIKTAILDQRWPIKS
ncbi:MAG TPA: type VI secretion system tube protein TssD [Fibrella sp.]